MTSRSPEPLPPGAAPSETVSARAEAARAEAARAEAARAGDPADAGEASVAAFYAKLPALQSLFPALAQAEAAEPLEHGEDNHNYAVTLASGERCVLRIYKEGTREHIAYELALARFLAARGFPTPPPHATAAGALSGEVEGDLVALFDFRAGRHLEHYSPANIATIAATAGRLHRLTAAFGRAPALSAEQVGRALVAQALEGPAQPRQDWARFRADVARYWERNQTAIRRYFACRSGAIHHDLHRWNLLFEGEEIVAVLDFGEVRRAPYILEVSRLGHYACCDPDTRLLDFDRLAIAVEAYLAEQPEIRPDMAHLKTAFDFANLVEAIDFLTTSDAEEFAHVDDCNSYQAFLANVDRDWPRLA